VPSLFRKGEQDVGDEQKQASATTTAPPGDSDAGEKQGKAQDADSVPGKAGRTAHAGRRKAETKVIVVADRGAADGHGDAYAFDVPEDAAEFIRSAVEDGMEPGHIHVFIGAEMRLNVAYRVEVNLDPPTGTGPA
jgi:hypothetical protein